MVSTIFMPLDNTTTLTHFRRNKLSLHYILDESNFTFILCGIDIPREKCLNDLHTVETIIRLHVPLRLIMVCTVSHLLFGDLQIKMG